MPSHAATRAIASSWESRRPSWANCSSAMVISRPRTVAPRLRTSSSRLSSSEHNDPMRILKRLEMYRLPASQRYKRHHQPVATERRSPASVITVHDDTTFRFR